MIGSISMRLQLQNALAIGVGLIYLTISAAQSYCDVATTSPADAVAAALPIKWERPVEEKCFYLLAMLNRLPEVRQAVLNDARLAKTGLAKRSEMLAAAENNAANLAMVTRSGQWTQTQIDDVGASLQKVLSASPTARDALLRQLKESGMFVRECTLSDDDLILHAWKTEARGMNHIMVVRWNQESLEADPMSPLDP